MSIPARTIPPDAVEVARQLYEQTSIPLDAIATTIGINRRTVSRWAREGAWASRSARLPKVMPQSRSAVRDGGAEGMDVPPIDTVALRTGEAPSRRELIARLVRRIEAEIAAVERLVAIIGRGHEADMAAGSERAARTLAILVRSLRELAMLEKNEAGGDDDADERDADAFRRELGDTLERVLAAGQAS